MQIRELEEKDFEQIVNIFYDYKRETGDEFLPKRRAPMLAVLKRAVDWEGSVALVAVEGEVVAGFINAHICLFPMLAGDEWYVTELFLNSRFRGQGVGGSLLDELERRARAAGVVRMMLHNFKDVESYKRDFYKKRGYTEREHAANFVKML